MFQLNPLGLTDAWWQHLLILLVSAIIGYIIGRRSGKAIIAGLDDRLSFLNGELEECRTTIIAQPRSAHDLPKLQADDFKIIEGIGPGIERVLYQAGIKTYEDLSETTSEVIKDILTNAGSRFQMHDPGTWPRQAALAAAGRLQELLEWQEKLDGGVE